MALAVLEDGSTLVVDHDDRGRVRVAGTFEGPVGAMAVRGGWSSTPVGGRIAVHRVTSDEAPAVGSGSPGAETPLRSSS